MCKITQKESKLNLLLLLHESAEQLCNNIESKMCLSSQTLKIFTFKTLSLPGELIVTRNDA